MESAEGDPGHESEAEIGECEKTTADEAVVSEADFITMEKKPEHSSVYVPASFFLRQAFKDLEAKGLAKIPEMTGYMLSYHSSTKQWRARDATHNRNYAPTWSPCFRILEVRRRHCA